MLTLPILALVLSAPTKDDPKPDLAKQIVGEWHLTKMTMFGGDPDVVPEGEAPPFVFIFEDGGKVTLKEAKPKGTRVQSGTYKLDATKDPAELDITPAKGAKDPEFQGIVKIAGDTLTFCGGQNGGPRPKTFASKKDDLTLLFEFKRVKKDK
jgi:uncharacterized protein (TIGR03067 family)